MRLYCEATVKHGENGIKNQRLGWLRAAVLFRLKFDLFRTTVAAVDSIDDPHIAGGRVRFSALPSVSNRVTPGA